jgi:predicted GNAT family acetyltransferase
MGRERWQKTEAGPREEAFLRSAEACCVGACARYLQEKKRRGLWALSGPDHALRALLVHSGHSLYPILRGSDGIPVPRFMRRFFGPIPLYVLQGLAEDTAVFEKMLQALGYTIRDGINYRLMTLDQEPAAETLGAGPPELIVRKPVPKDMEAVFPLQAAYEQEEVLPRGTVFNPRNCRLSLARIFSRERILVAELNSRIVGKINTNAESFTRYQIGGVYVLPECRNRGIATRMTAVLAAELIAAGRGLTLFVKKQNSTALAVYRRIGFKVLGDYRICYY